MIDRKTLVLDPGHGGTVAVGGSTPNRGISPNGLFEKDLALEIANRVRDRLRSDFTVVLTRESDTNVSLAERASSAKRVAADMFLSIHLSGSVGPAVSATEVVTARGAQPGSIALANAVLARVGAVTGTPGAHLRADLGQLVPDRHDPRTAACLVELASLDDPTQARQLLDVDYRAALADALATSVRDAAAGVVAAPQWLGVRRARAAAIVAPDIDYAVTNLADAVAIWHQWFLRYGSWQVGVPDHALPNFPHAAICQLELRDAADNVGYGTGFYIAPEVILTCGHNFFNPPNWTAASVDVQPAYSSSQSILPARTYTVNPSAIVHPRWWSSNGADTGFDLAVLRVPGLPATAGAFSLPNVSLAPSEHIVVCGYGKVSGTPFESQGQRMDGSTITNVDWELAYYPIQTIGGHSGSPVFHESMVIAVHTGPRILGTQISQHENRGVLLTPEKNDWIVQMAGGGVSIGLSRGRTARALTDANSTQTEQSDEVRRRVAVSIGRAEAGGRYDLVHDDSARVNFGVGSWTGTRIADVLDTYVAYAARQGLSDQLNAHFGGGAGLAGLRDRFRHDGTATVLSEAEREQLRALGRDAVLTGAQDEHLANDLRIDLDAIGNDGPPWYPYIDAGMDAITEIAAHVLVHARHQAGGSGLHDILDAVTAHFGGEPALGSGMVAGTITERNVLDQVAEQVVARVGPEYRDGVRRRYQTLFTDHADSQLSYYFRPAS